MEQRLDPNLAVWSGRPNPTFSRGLSHNPTVQAHAAQVVVDPYPEDPIWSAVGGLIDAAPGLAELRWHRLHLLAAERWREQGLEVPEELLREERHAALRTTGALMILERIRAAYDGRMALIKGYEVAVRFPNPLARAFADIDLLVEDAAGAHRALREAGFIEVGDPERYVDIHHLQPLALPNLMVPVEIHRQAKWPAGMNAPSTAELLDAAVPSATGVGIPALAPADHALVLAAHSWAHLPLRRLIELVDTALIAREADPAEIEARARAYGFERVWRTTRTTVDSLFYGGSPTLAQRTWARHLAAARERTVFESHVERWLSPFWALPLGPATSRMGSTARTELGPAEGETWRGKLTRVLAAIRHASAPRTEHDRQLGSEAHRHRKKR